jgi:hypothetical protein
MYLNHYLSTRNTHSKLLSYHKLNSVKLRIPSISVHKLNHVGITVSLYRLSVLEKIVLIILGAILVPVNPQHRILKIPWSRPTGNDVVIQEKRVSNRHCKLSLGLQGHGSSIGDGEPDVWIEDLKSSNGTFVSYLPIGTEFEANHTGQWRETQD